MIKKIGFWILLLGIIANSYAIELIKTAPAIDGKLDDSCWKTAKRYTDFKEYNSRKKSKDSYFSIAMDKYYLYIAVSNIKKGISKEKAPKLQHDGPVYHHESIELFLDSEGLADTFYQIIINPWKAVFDTYYTQGGIVSEKGWQSSMKFATKISDNKWTLEVAIPLAELTLPLKSKEFGINVVRNTNNKSYTFADLKGSYMQPTKFFKMRYPAKANFAKFNYTFTLDDEIKIDAKKNAITLECVVGNQTGRYRQVTVAASSSDINNKTSSTSFVISPKQHQRIFLTIPLKSLQGNKELKFVVHSQKDAKKQFKIISKRVLINYTPVELNIINPHYRNSLYATQRDRTLKVAVKLNCDDNKKYSVENTFSFEGKILKSTKSAIDCKAPVVFTVSAPENKFGKCLVKTAIAYKGKVLYNLQKTINILPPNKHEWRLNKENILLYNGKKKLIIAFTSIASENYKQARKAGINSFLTYGLQSLNGKALDDFMKKAGEADLLVIGYPYPSSDILYKLRKGTPLTKADKDALRARIRELKKYPQILGWYLVDEPMDNKMVHEIVKQVYEICREEAPYKPATLCANYAETVKSYADVCDVMLPDVYPGFMKGKRALRDIECVSTRLKIANQNNQCVWFVPQYFNWRDWNRAGQRAPDFVEQRNMMYQAIIEGATGFDAYSYDMTLPNPQLRMGSEYIFKELHLLKDFVLSSDIKEAVCKDKKMLVSSRHAGNSTVIFAVNCATRNRPATIKLSKGSAKIKQFYILGTNKRVNVVDGKINAHFEPYGTNIYVSSNKYRMNESLRQVEEKIAKALKIKYKKGNLISELNIDDSCVSSSKPKKYYGSAFSLNNSLYGQRKWTPSPNSDPWIEFDFKKNTIFKKVVFFGCKSLYSADIVVFTSGSWHKVKSKVSLQKDGSTAYIFEPQTATKLKILPKDKTQLINEIEVYNK